MLIGKPTKFAAGLQLLGDVNDLKSLHDTIHFLSGDECTPGNEIMLNLAYDVRKASYGQREKFTIQDEENIQTYYGFKIFWTFFIGAILLLRDRASYTTTGNEVQSNLYRLETILEKALTEYNFEIGSLIFYNLRFYKLVQLEYIDLLIQHISFANIQSENGIKRFKQLNEDLKLLSPFNKEHIEFKSQLEKEAKKRNCSLSALKMTFDYDKITFKW